MSVYLSVCVPLALPVVMADISGVVSLTNEEASKQLVQQSASSYVDQLIDGQVAEDLPPDQLPSIESLAEDEGHYRSYVFSTNFNRVESDAGSRFDRINVLLKAYAQTPSYGNFNFEAKLGQLTVRNVPDDSLALTPKKTTQGQHFTLQQTAFALSEDWVMSNVLGVNKAFQNPLLSRSAQVNLNAFTFEGLSSRIHSETTDIRLMAGEKGRQTETDDFEKQGDKLLGLGLARHLNDEWSVGLQTWKLDMLEEPDWQQEYTVFAQYRKPDGSRQLKLQALAADQQTGYWLDLDARMGRFTHQAGFSRLDGNLHWMGEVLADDSSSAFWRFSYSHPKYNTHTALDWKSSDTLSQLGMRQSVEYRVDQRQSLGADIAYTRSSPQNESKHRKTSASMHYAQQWSPEMYHRLQLSFIDTDLDERGSGWEADYSQQWRLSGDHELDLQLSAQSQSLSSVNDNTYQFGASWRKVFAEGDFAGVSFNISSNDTVDAETEDDTDPDAKRSAQQLRLYMNKRLGKHWGTEASVDWRKDREDKAFNVVLSYQNSKGMVVADQWRRSGVVKGVVFYDENGDGLRQPLEKLARGIVVTLNEQAVPQTTDINGEFEFSHVQTGFQQLEIAEESIPLPWEWVSRERGKVDVKLRQTQLVYLPLVRLSAE